MLTHDVYIFIFIFVPRMASLITSEVGAEPCSMTVGLLFFVYRLFTAADSDDISTVVRFISKSRPWTTLMSVGWGYGANMLTKYLAEVGERTPLTAAVCIDNPFDLNEATKFHPHLSPIDEKLMGGLVDILQANKVKEVLIDIKFHSPRIRYRGPLFHVMGLL